MGTLATNKPWYCKEQILRFAEEKTVFMNASEILKTLHHSIIASVQADQGEPLNKPEHITAMAMACINGGAKGLRLANPENIQAVKRCLPDIPVIGITKPFHPLPSPENHVYITPNLWTAESVCQAGADIVAMDATQRPRTGESLQEIVAVLRERFPKVLLMADIATEADAYQAANLGFDFIGTTLSGYTTETTQRAQTGQPDFELLQNLTQNLSVPIILEGRIWEPQHVTQAFELGAYAVVIGSAITRPHVITRRFAQAIPKPVH